MEQPFSKVNIAKLQHQFRRVRLACLAAIELGDCRAVARLTCEAARLRTCLRLLGADTALEMA